MRFEFVTQAGESYLFWIRRETLYNAETHDWHDRLTLTTRPYGYIFAITRVNGEYIIDWENWAGKKTAHRKEKMDAIPGFVEYLDKFIKLMVFI